MIKTTCTDGNINVANKEKKKDTSHVFITRYVLDTIVHFLYSSHIIDLSQLSCTVGFIYQYPTNEKTGAQKDN